MDYKEFKRLYDGDRIVFMLGMELLLENGRNAIQKHEEEELIQAVKEQLSNLFVPEKANEIVRAAKAFSRLQTAALLTYASKCDIQLGIEDEDTPGVCPVCCGPLIYEGAADNALTARWTCQDCQATGTENYRKLFDGHCDVRLADGRPVPPRES